MKKFTTLSKIERKNLIQKVAFELGSTTVPTRGNWWVWIASFQNISKEGRASYFKFWWLPIGILQKRRAEVMPYRQKLQATGAGRWCVRRGTTHRSRLCCRWSACLAGWRRATLPSGNAMRSTRVQRPMDRSTKTRGSGWFPWARWNMSESKFSRKAV